MDKQLKNRLVEPYPQWHKKPLRLTCKEINKPKIVMDAFFDTYPLPGLRILLQQLLRDAIHPPHTTNAAEHVTTCHDIERLIEAVLLLYKKKEHFC